MVSRARKMAAFVAHHVNVEYGNCGELKLKRLFHVSDNKDIRIFEPRPSPHLDGKVTGLAVWAIDEDHLPHYLLPRDCPRICLRASAQTSPDDCRKFFPQSQDRILAVEFGWYERIKSAELYLYQIPADAFTEVDAIAGYFISRQAVAPLQVTRVGNLAEEIVRRGYKLRLLPNLWSLYDEVLASSVQYSIIRMRNAQPRPEKKTF